MISIHHLAAKARTRFPTSPETQPIMPIVVSFNLAFKLNKGRNVIVESVAISVEMDENMVYSFSVQSNFRRV